MDNDFNPAIEKLERVRSIFQTRVERLTVAISELRILSKWSSLEDQTSDKHREMLDNELAKVLDKRIAEENAKRAHVCS